MHKELLCYFLLSVTTIWLVLCDPKICTNGAGCFDGLYMTGYQTGDYEAYLGIPYAFKPRRFERAQRFFSNQTFDAKKSKPDCLQKNYLLPKQPITGSEDCLYLNVYKQENTSRYMFPVMVYFHGGGFFAGSSAPLFVGPEYIMDHKNVILVTINYRLGAFGFLTTNDDYLPGNLGLKDQLLALQWVFNHINRFGGNPRYVTLFGQSAGAVSAHMHMLSILSRYLFKGVIAMSGTANVPFAIDENPEYTARQTAKYCNISNWDKMSTENLAKALKNVSQYTLLNAGDHLKYWDVDNLVNYKPVIEEPGPDAFISEHPEKLLRTGCYNAVPVLFGRVPNEGGVRAIAIMESDKLRNAFNADFYNLMVKFLEFPPKFNETQISVKMQMIINEYFNGVFQLNDDTRQGFVDLVTDRGFYQPFYNMVKYYTHTIDTSKFPIFMYKFDFVGPNSYAPIYAGGPPKHNYGVVHGDDTIYLFRSPFVFPDFGKNSTDANAVKQFVENIVHFVNYRRPKISPPFKECTKDTFMPGPGKMCDYQLFTNDSDRNLVINIENEFNTQRMEFWNTILEVPPFP